MTTTEVNGDDAGTDPSGGDRATRPVVMPGHAEPTIYDVARVAGVSPSTVSRALSKPGRVSFKTAEHVRQVAAQLGYGAVRIERTVSERGSGLLAILVADIANPVFFGIIRGAERAANELGFTNLIVETQETERIERDALNRLIPVVDGVVLSASRMSDAAIREVAKRKPLVLLNRVVSEVPSVISDNVHAIKKASEYLTALGHSTITYLAGPEASWSDGVRWRGLREAAHELDLRVHRIGPFLPTMRGGAAAAEQWLTRPTTAVIAYNDLMAIGFIQTVTAAGRSVPGDVSVIGFDNIVDATLVEPHLTTIAAPLVSLGSAAVAHVIKRTKDRLGLMAEPVVLPARLVVRDSTGPRHA
jgi:DNA-binding LacI/PurR family transcriptional regulator